MVAQALELLRVLASHLATTPQPAEAAGLMPLPPCPDGSALPEGGASRLAESDLCSLPQHDGFALPEGGASPAESGDPCSLPGTGSSSIPESNASAPPDSGAYGHPGSGVSGHPESGVYHLPESGASGFAEGGAEGSDRSRLLIPATLALLDLLPTVGPLIFDPPILWGP